MLHPPTDAVLIIDVRDLAEFCVHMIENDVGGVYNSVGPKADLSIAEMLYGIRAVTTADVAASPTAEALRPHCIPLRHPASATRTPKTAL